MIDADADHTVPDDFVAAGIVDWLSPEDARALDDELDVARMQLAAGNDITVT